MIKKLMPALEIRNRCIDRVYRFISPSYTTIKLEFEPEDFEFIKKGARMLGMSVHQFIEYAVREQIKEEGRIEKGNV